MRTVTLCGSARMEQHFIDANRMLTLHGCVVISMSVLPSQAPNNAGKDWYSASEKHLLDLIHLEKIRIADAVLVVGDGYFGHSTAREILYSSLMKKPIYAQWIETQFGDGVLRCANEGFHDGADLVMRAMNLLDKE